MAPVKRSVKVSAVRHCKLICGTVQSVPFWDWKEHDHVGVALVNQSNDIMSTGEALERVAVWKTRSTKIAHAIESTAALVQIILRDQERMLSAGISTTELRHAYASAILRSVNGLADTLQQQRFAASSVAVLCAELGVPPWLVAIRHEATHNQLPPLPTLRMAAQALVQYFSTVYWEPTRQRHEQQYEHAWSLLCQYETAAINREQVLLQTRSTESQPTVDDTCPDDTLSDNGEYDVDEDVLEVDGLLQSPLGTTSNRFAVLVETKPKIEKIAILEDVPAKEPAMKKPKLELDDYVKLNQMVAASAKQFVLAEIPMDVFHRAAVDFLVVRSHENSRLSKSESFDSSKLVQRFHLLLSTLGRSWPGFLTSFLNECIKQIVEVEGEHQDRDSSATEVSIVCFTFESWVHLLLSRIFLSQVERKTKKTEAKTNVKLNQGKEFADLETLQSLQYPLNRICDELLGHAVLSTSFQRNPDFVRYRLAELILSILGDERFPLYGFDEPIFRAMCCNPSKQKPKQPRPVGTTPLITNSMLSLESMEAFLDDTKANNAIRSPPTSNAPHTDENDGFGEPVSFVQAKGSIWVQCQSWEPCAIGSSSCILKKHLHC